MNNKVEELMRKYHYGFKHSNDLLEDEYVKDLNKEIERLNNIINELEKTFVNDDKRIKEYNIEHPESPLDNYSRYYLDKLKELKEGKK